MIMTQPMMMLAILGLLSLPLNMVKSQSFFHYYNYTDWEVYGEHSNDTYALPNAAFGMAVGYDIATDTVWLFGGYSDIGEQEQQLYSFQSGYITQRTDIEIPAYYSGHAQSYTQIDSFLYTLDHKTRAIDRFNMDNVSFEQSIALIPDQLEMTISERSSCLASFYDATDDADYLVVISGGTSSAVHMLNINTNEWMSNVPSLNFPRQASACIAHNGWLYSIGGLNGTSDAYGDGGVGDLCCGCTSASSTPNCEGDDTCSSYVAGCSLHCIHPDATVCAYDSYCCAYSWDSLCAGHAVDECQGSEEEAHHEETNVIEVLDISKAYNIKRQSWIIIYDLLYDNIAYHRAVVYNNEVMVMGGGHTHYWGGSWTDDYWNYCIDIEPNNIGTNVLNTNYTISLRKCGYLNIGAFMMSPVVTSSNIVAIGGYTSIGGYALTAWEVRPDITFPTVMPTEPTSEPTTATPTMPPTSGEWKTMYVRHNGCDYGYCTHSDRDYDAICEVTPGELDHDQGFCCSDTTAQPTPEPSPDLSNLPLCCGCAQSDKCGNIDTTCQDLVCDYFTTNYADKYCCFDYEYEAQSSLLIWDQSWCKAAAEAVCVGDDVSNWINYPQWTTTTSSPLRRRRNLLESAANVSVEVNVTASTCCECTEEMSGTTCPADDVCTTLVCAQDSFCCENSWDWWCTQIAVNITTNCPTTQSPIKTTQFPTSHSGTTKGSSKTTAPTTTANVSTAHPTTQGTDKPSTQPTTAVNDLCCDCLVNSTDAGCPADIECQNAVCAVDPWCCSYYWDSYCVWWATKNATDSDCSTTMDPTSFPSTMRPSIDPTSAAPTGDTQSPSRSPSRAPTPYCKYFEVRVLDADGFNASAFDGLYELSDTILFERAAWIDRDDPDDRNLYHAAIGWILNGKGDEQMSYSDNDYFPDSNASWYHISSPGTFHVDLNCISTDFPTFDPTNNPSKSPSLEPTNNPTLPANLCCNCGVTTTTPGCDADSKCESLVCAQDGFCCSNYWDSWCVNWAESFMTSCITTTTRKPTSTPTVTITDNPSLEPTNLPSLEPTMPTSNPSEIPTLEPTIPSMAPTREPTINYANYTCCLCTDDSTAPGCQAHGRECQSQVCGDDPFCCIMAWDSWCADAAQTICDSNLQITGEPTTHFPTARTNPPTPDTTAPTRSPTTDPTAAPTLSPTAAPSRAPTIELYSTCESIKYSWNCFLGKGGFPDPFGCERQGYRGNGVFDIGDGDWRFPFHLHLNNSNVTIRGQGPNDTMWIYTGNEPYWIGCRHEACEIALEDLTIASTRNNYYDQMFYMVEGGKLRIKNVMFDGHHYHENLKSTFWTISGQDTEVVVEDSHFTNNGAMYQFLNGSNTIFRNCTFDNNVVNTTTAVSSNHHLREIEIELLETLENELCDNSSWNEILGNWSYKKTDSGQCILENVDSGSGNNMWFGSADGSDPNDDFIHESFELTVVMAQHSGSNAGVIFRAPTATIYNDVGPNYYAGINVGSQHVVWGMQYNGWHQYNTSTVALEWGEPYVLTIQAQGTNYNIYLNGTLVLKDQTGTVITSGSIGVRTYYAPSTFYSVTYHGENSDDDEALLPTMFYVDNATVQFEDCTFSENVHADSYLISVHESAKVTVRDSTFVDNKSPNNNSALFYVEGHNDNTWLSIVDTRFERNIGYKSMIYGHGTAYRSGIVVEGSEFTSNEVSYDVFIGGSGYLVVEDTVFTNASRENSLYLEDTDTVINGTIWKRYEVADALLNNGWSSPNSSNAEYIELSEKCAEWMAIMHALNYTNFDCRGNATIWNDSLIVSNSIISNMKGALFGAMSTMTFSASTFVNNKFASNLYVDNESSIQFEQCLFANNTLTESLFSVCSGELSISNSEFEGNHDAEDGAYFTLIDVFPSNTTTIDNYGTLRVEGCTIKENGNMSRIVEAKGNPDILIYVEGNNVTDNCDDGHCIIVLDADLWIDQVSLPMNDSLLFGHDINDNKNDSDSTKDKNITLHLIDFDLFDTHWVIDLVAFGEENGSIVMEPCDRYDPSELLNDPAFDVLVGDNLLSATYVFDSVGAFIQQSMLCNGTGMGTGNRTGPCYVSCEDLYACSSATIEITAPDFALLSCTALGACYSAQVTMRDSAEAAVICKGSTACKESTITLRNVSSATIECESAESCAELVVFLYDSPNTTIICYAEGACNSTHIISDSDDIELYFHNFNSGVQIQLPTILDLDRLHCADDAYLSLDGDTVYNYTMEQHLQQLFQSPLPCHGLTFEFTESDEPSCEVGMVYNALPYYAHFESFIKCYQVWYHETVNISCTGTAAPTVDPTLDPTSNPTTAEPTRSPTSKPSFSPTMEDEYDSYFSVTYGIQNLNSDNVETLSDNLLNVTADIVIIIEAAYQDHANLGNVGSEKYWVQIEDINGYELNALSENPELYQILNASKVLLQMNGRVLCVKAICDFILEVFDRDMFEGHVTGELQTYFDVNGPQRRLLAINEQLGFYVASMADAAESLNPTNETPPDYVLIGMATVVGLLCLVALAAFLFNKSFFPKFPGASPVDDALWMSVVAFALQFWDFASDVNLCTEVWQRPDVFDRLLIMICAFGTTIFILIPYFANLVYAMRIKSVIGSNEAAKSWFQYRSSIFTILVVITGGCYPALALISSNIFGLKVMSCGLTQHELKKLMKIKVFTTIILENCPQLIVQALYAYSVEVTEAVVLAFFASLLSVAASTMSYVIDREGVDNETVEYYIVLAKTGKLVNDRNTTTRQRPNYMNDLDDDEKEYQMETAPHRSSSTGTGGRSMIHHSSNDNLEGESDPDALTVEEKQLIINNKGRTQALGEHLAAVFEIPSKNIEIGATLITRRGAKIHIVHHISRLDLQAMQNEMANAHSSMDAIVTKSFFAKTMFNFKKDAVTKVLMDHYGFTQGFEAVFSDYHERAQSFGPFDDGIPGLPHMNAKSSSIYGAEDSEELYPPRQGTNLTMIREMVHQHQVTASQQIDLDNLIELAHGLEEHDGDEHATGNGDGHSNHLALAVPEHQMNIAAQQSESPPVTPDDEVELAQTNIRSKLRLQHDEGMDEAASPHIVISPMTNDYRMHQEVASGSDMGAYSDHSEMDHDDEYLGNIVDEVMTEHPDLHSMQTLDSAAL